MTEEEQGTVERFLAASARADAHACAECFDEEAEVFLPRNDLEGSAYRGREGAYQAWKDAFDMWASIRFEVADTREGRGGMWVALGRTTNVGRGEMPTVEYEAAYVAKFRNGRLAYFRPYLSHAEALEAAGLSA